MLKKSVKILLTGLIAVCWWVSLSLSAWFANIPSELGIAAALMVLIALSLVAILLIRKLWKAEAQQCVDFLSSLD